MILLGGILMKNKVINTLIISAISLTSLNLLANVSIQCGDTNSAYVNMDLSDNFKQKHLSDSKISEYQKEGLSYIIAGRNCGLDAWDNLPRFQVLFLYEGKKPTEVFDLGPMTIFPATIDLDMNQLSDEFSTNGMILSGDGNTLTSEGGISGSIEHRRGKGSVKVIIELDNNN